jgi:CysZ protein
MTPPLAQRPPDALARPPARLGFFDGTAALFSGFGFVLRRPEVWPLALVPVAVALVITALAGGTAIELIAPRITASIVGHLGQRWGFVATIVNVVAGAFALVAAALVGFGLAQPLSGPALNRIVRRAEADLGAPEWPATSALVDVGRALQSIVFAYVFGLPILIVLYLITFFFPPAAVVTFPLKLVVLGILAAWDLCDYPLSAHGIPIGDRVTFMIRNAAAMIGFGFGLALLSFVPCALVLALPAGVAGAARLTRKIELAEAQRSG